MNHVTQLPRVLIVDESRMVRAMIIKHIRDSYDFREESNGEAAWQVLVLDQSIQLVICSLSLPVLDGDGLLVLFRTSGFDLESFVSSAIFSLKMLRMCANNQLLPVSIPQSANIPVINIRGKVQLFLLINPGRNIH